MSKIVVEPDGRIIIPDEITTSQGLKPGDELVLIPRPGGLTLLHPKIAHLLEDHARELRAWYESLSPEQRAEVDRDFAAYDALSKEDQERLWNEPHARVLDEPEDDEIDTTKFRPARQKRN
jgi:bifunctional DNA-binding transcriptional regulator/antitoxin component of YhaV-PrlF toxin-antitoxin module